MRNTHVSRRSAKREDGNPKEARSPSQYSCLRVVSLTRKTKDPACFAGYRGGKRPPASRLRRPGRACTAPLLSGGGAGCSRHFGVRRSAPLFGNGGRAEQGGKAARSAAVQIAADLAQEQGVFRFARFSHFASGRISPAALRQSSAQTTLPSSYRSSYGAGGSAALRAGSADG